MRPPRHLPKTGGGYDITWVRTSAVSRFCNPFDGCWPELDTPISVAEVEACLRAGDEAEHRPFDLGDWRGIGTTRFKSYRHMHVQKIAWFARHGFQRPILVDVGCPSLGWFNGWFVEDGNHRLAAAIFRLHQLGDDHWIPISLAGSLKYAKEIGIIN